MEGRTVTQKRFDEMQSATVEEARRLARKMVAAEARGPGDFENARHRLEAKYGVSLWGLMYRAPKDVGMAAFGRLRAAYFDHCEAVIRRTRDEIAIERAKGAATDADLGLLAEAEELLAKVAERKARG